MNFHNATKFTEALPFLSKLMVGATSAGTPLLGIYALFGFISIVAILIVTSWAYIYTSGTINERATLKICIAILVILVIINAIIRMMAFSSFSGEWNSVLNDIRSVSFKFFTILDGFVVLCALPVVMFTIPNLVFKRGRLSNEQVSKLFITSSILIIIADALLRIVEVILFPDSLGYFIDQIFTSEYTWAYPSILSVDYFIATIATVAAAIFAIWVYYFAKQLKKFESFRRVRTTIILLVFAIDVVIDIQGVMLITTSDQHTAFLIGFIVLMPILLTISLIIWVVRERRQIQEKEKTDEEKMEEVISDVSKALASFAQATKSANNLLQVVKDTRTKNKEEETLLTETITSLKKQAEEFQEKLEEVKLHYQEAKAPIIESMREVMDQQNSLRFRRVSFRRDVAFFLFGFLVSIVSLLATIIFGILSINVHP